MKMNDNRRIMRAQSAMEYLMTYGWAILIIAVVLGALFSLGVFSSGNLLGTACIAYSGFECQNPLLHSSTFTATIGQSTGTSWTAANLIFMGSGSGTPTSASFNAFGTNTITCPPYTVSGGLSSGSSTTFTTANYMTGATTCSPMPATVGQTVAGTIWAQYNTASTSGLITQVATINIKAT
jgi:hypothetical protein